MSSMFDPLVQLYRTAIAFLCALVVALAAMAMLAKYIVWLALLLVLAIVLRLAWARTSRY